MYKSEKELKNHVTKRHILYQDYACKYPSYMGVEVDMGRYIPDIVLVLFKEKPIEDIIPQRWTLKHSFVLYHVREKGPVSSNRVADFCYSDLESIERILDNMRKSGMIKKSEEGYEEEEELNSWKSDIIGVELKMKRWSRAVKQAERYKEFADSVHVVMPGDEAHNATDNLVRFREKGVGLSVVHGETERAVLPAVAEQPHDPRHQHIQVSALLGHTPNWLRYEPNASSQA